jgi:dTDP-4-amino-4,6-dideoxygalactose transaminase
MGLAGLEEFDENLKHRQRLFSIYEDKLVNIPGLSFIGGRFTDRQHAAWLCTVAVDKRTDLQIKLREHHIESNQVHYRNDRYSVFGKRCDNLPNMDAIEDKYLVLPLHTKIQEEDVYKICEVIRSGW